jgi:hypothetical protein
VVSQRKRAYLIEKWSDDVPAIDHCEPQVIRAFEKAYWEVLDKPYLLRIRGER